MTWFRAFGSELKRRRVWRTAALYAAAAFVGIQVADLAFPGLGIPEQAIRFVWIGAIAGLGIALLFGWRYQMTPRGIVRTPPRSAESDAGLPLGRPDFLILGALGALVGAITLQLALEIRGVPDVMRLGPWGHDVPRNAVAVLPLENLSGDPEQEYFAAGIHDALITTLSRIGALTVKAASSTRVYRNIVQPARQTGLELGVAHLVEGSVFRAEERVRINVRLISTVTEENVWSESYERHVEDVLTLQAEVTRAIADAVQVRVTPDEATRLASARQVDPAVYEVYLRGMFHLNQYTPDGIQQGLRYLHEAIAMAPEDPLAYAGLALGYSLIGHSANPPPGAFATAREAAAKALELDPLYPEAHAAMAEIQLYYDWDWEGAERSFRRALQLNPNLEFAHAHYAWLDQLMGDIEPAIEHMTRAKQIAPLTPIFTAWLGWLYWSDGRLDEAVAEARQSLEVNPRFPWGLYVLGGAYAARGEHEEAVATFELLRELDPSLGHAGLGFASAQVGDTLGAHAAIDALSENPGQKDLLAIGIIYAILGDVDASIEWLERTREARVDWFPWIGGENGYDHFIALALENLRGDPRFERLVAPLGIPRQG